jgi:hypothetical protein
LEVGLDLTVEILILAIRFPKHAIPPRRYRRSYLGLTSDPSIEVVGLNVNPS